MSDKGFDQLLGIIRKMLPTKNELPEKTYLAKQMICPIGLEVEKSTRVPMNAYCTMEKNTKTWTSAPKCEVPRYKEGSFGISL